MAGSLIGLADLLLPLTIRFTGGTPTDDGAVAVVLAVNLAAMIGEADSLDCQTRG